ncbi:MAG: tetratricopeptide repeat protein [Alphaproteobacteria bacterium]|nr:tetratricopeptide repeat protein [Alphaproteobacteria bacterium]
MRPRSTAQTAIQATAQTTLAYGAGQIARVGWYLGHYAATRRWFARHQPAPSRRSLRGRLMGARIQAALAKGALALMARDLANVRAGRYPLPRDLIPPPFAATRDAVRYWRDLPRVAGRRASKTAQEPIDETTRDAYPHYYLQNFHYQSGGWLTEESAALYDTQVEILFGGLADAMRRQALVPLATSLANHGTPDGVGMRLLDLGTGTGNLLAMAAEAFPALTLDGLDLSPAYLDRARRRLGARDVTWHQAPAEAMPLPDASVDLITASFLFHELPANIRAQVLREAIRVLKPGGRVVIVDSLQLGDTPALDPVLKSFPVQFHEPYFQSWIETDAAALFAKAGLTVQQTTVAYLSKVFVSDCV